MKQKFHLKFTASLLLLTLAISLVLGLFGDVQPASALLDVPVTGDGGAFDRVDSIGSIDTSGYDQGQLQNEITQTAASSAMNDAFQAMDGQFTSSVETDLGIGNPAYYEDALVEGKFIPDLYSKYNGSDSVPIGCKGLGVDCIAATEMSLPMNNMTTAQLQQLASLQGATAANSPAASTQLTQDIQRIVVGASSLFQPSIACGGIDANALDKAASYLAASTAGVVANQIDPGSGMKFYQDMSKLGSPYATNPFWKLQLQDTAMLNQSNARGAAANEINSPGLKATQATSTAATQYSQIQRTLSLVKNGEDSSGQALFNVAINAVNGTYNTATFRNFLIQLVSNELARIAATQISKFVGWIASFIGSGVGLAQKDQFRLLAENSARTIAQGLIQHFAVNLFTRLSQKIFQGQILAESTRCRQPKTLANFTPAATTFTAAANTPIQAFGDTGPTPPTPPPGGPPSSIIFNAPASINAGGTVVLTWDASAAPAGSTVTLTGGALSGAVPLVGSRNDTPSVTTTYTLTVTGPGFNQTVQRTVVVTAGGASAVTFDVQPRSVVAGDTVTITWDASAIPNAQVEIFPLSTSLLPVSGAQDFTINATTVFVFTVVDPSGANPDIARTITVTVTTGGGCGAVICVLGAQTTNPQFGVRE
jgi:hypothetical protein